MNLKKPSRTVFLALAASAMLLAAAPGALRAESNVPISDLGAFGILVDPNASGTKLNSTVAFAYEDERNTERALACVSDRWVRNLHVVAAVTKGNTMQVFSSNYSVAGLDNLQDCFDQQDKQVAFLKYFLERVVIATLYDCSPGGCPAFAVKSIKNFLMSGIGGASLEVEIAVRP